MSRLEVGRKKDFPGESVKVDGIYLANLGLRHYVNT